MQFLWETYPDRIEVQNGSEVYQTARSHSLGDTQQHFTTEDGISTQKKIKTEHDIMIAYRGVHGRVQTNPTKTDSQMKVQFFH